MGTQDIFEKKLAYIISMTKTEKIFQIPLSWWEYAAPTTADSKTNLHGIHECGTVFKILRLDKEFESQYYKRLNEEGIVATRIEKGICYKVL